MNKVYEILDLEQGSDKWLNARLDYFCSTEAAVITGDSKYMSRNQLLDLKKGWRANPASEFKEKLFMEGHEKEDMARDLYEITNLVDIPPMVLSREIDGLPCLGSYDGFSENDGRLVWEHKMYNATLAENVRNRVLEPHYYWQLEHLMMVCDTDRCVFQVSDGTINNCEEMEYQCVPERRKKLIAYYKQFLIDLESHELQAKEEKLLPAKVESFPLVTFEMQGNEVVSNIGDCLPAIRDRAEKEMSRKLESDQDFKDKDKLNKEVIKAREKLKLLKEQVQSKFESFNQFVKDLQEADDILQKMQSHGTKQVDTEKKRKKKNIADKAKKELEQYIESLSTLLSGRCVNVIPESLTIVREKTAVDLALSMKNKRTIQSCQDSVSQELANRKASIKKVIDECVVPNIDYLDQNYSEYDFLFFDIANYVEYDHEQFTMMLRSKVEEHKEKQKEREAGQMPESVKDISHKGYKNIVSEKYGTDHAQQGDIATGCSEYEVIEDSFLPDGENPIAIKVVMLEKDREGFIQLLRAAYENISIQDDLERIGDATIIIDNT